MNWIAKGHLGVASFCIIISKSFQLIMLFESFESFESFEAAHTYFNFIPYIILYIITMYMTHV